MALAAPLSNAELDSIHAGFIDAAGVQFSLGVSIKNYVDGQLVLSSTMTMDKNGVTVLPNTGLDSQALTKAITDGTLAISNKVQNKMSNLISNADPAPDTVPNPTPAPTVASNLVSNPNPVPAPVTSPSPVPATVPSPAPTLASNLVSSPSPVPAAVSNSSPTPATVPSPAPTVASNLVSSPSPVPNTVLSPNAVSNTVQIPGDGGTTSFIQNLMNNQFSNVVVNSASNRTITQNTDIAIAVPNLQTMQQGIAFSKLVSGLQSAVGLQQLTARH